MAPPGDTHDELLSLEAIEARLAEKVDLFNTQIPEEPKLAKMLAKMERSVLIQVGEEVGFATQLAEARLAALTRVALPREEAPDILLAMDQATLSGLLGGTMKPVKAYATKKLKVKAQVKDLLVLKKLLQA